MGAALALAAALGIEPMAAAELLPEIEAVMVRRLNEAIGDEMAEKRVSVRLAVVGGREVRAELEGVGEAGNRGFGRLGREMEAANARLAAFSRAGEGRDRGCRRRGGRRRHRHGPLRARHGRRAGEARAVARHHGRLDPGAGARGRARRRRDVGHRAGDQGPDPPAEPGGLRRRARGRGARPARALGLRAARAAARRAGRPHQPGDRRLRARGRARRGRRPALRRGRLDRHVAASTPRRCARRPRTCATSASWSPRRTPTGSSAPTTRSRGSG